MKKTFLFLMLCIMSMTSIAQVSFSKFKLVTDNPLGCCPGRKALEYKFTNTGDRALKYVNIYYYAVNAVGDVISGATHATIRVGAEELVKPRLVQNTGPFEPGKSQSGWISALLYADKRTTVIPFQLEIVYMGENEPTFITIDKDNIGTYFPKVKWVDYNRVNRAI